MVRIAARWKLKSCVLKCPGCGRYLIAEFVGSWRMRKASDKERTAAGKVDDPTPQQSNISRAYARESDGDEGAERGDGA